MLTSKDLMIGDWFAFQGHPYKCTASDIEALAECEEKGIPTDISEIPLTAEILEKNFPDPKIVCWYPDNNTFRIIIGDDVALNIEYVHELQHALRLCGIEKEIEL